MEITTMYKNGLQIFQNSTFGTIRTVEENGKVLFCGKDIATALGYAIPSKAVNTHCKGVSKMEVPTNGGIQQMLFIPEGDIYRLAAKSELPGADEFERWIFDEVLPAIRKHGMYAVDELLENPDIAIRAFTALKEERAKRKALEIENAQQKQLIAEYEPKAQYLDKILNDKGTLAVQQIAADYGLTAQRLNQILRDKHIQHKTNGQWLLNKKYMNMGYTKSKEIPIPHKDGSHSYRLHTQWTQKGRLFIHELLQGLGINAVMDKQYAKCNQKRII